MNGIKDNSEPNEDIKNKRIRARRITKKQLSWLVIHVLRLAGPERTTQREACEKERNPKRWKMTKKNAKQKNEEKMKYTRRRAGLLINLNANWKLNSQSVAAGRDRSTEGDCVRFREEGG